MKKAARLALMGGLLAFVGWGMKGTGAAPPMPSPEPEPKMGVPLPSPEPPEHPPEVARPAPVRAAGPEFSPPPRHAGPAPRLPKAVPFGATTPGSPRASIGASEVTVARFRACVDAGACKPEQFLANEGAPCNWGVPGRDDHPMNCVDFFGASAFCAYDGGRLCKPDEWFAACRGPSNWDYPYGPEYREDACLARSGPAAAAGGTEPAGSRTTCQGGTPGVHDMAGNVTEWVDDCNGTYCHFYGGSYLTNDPVPDFASCKHVCAGNQKAFRSSTLGIRCCYDKGS